MSKFRKEMEKTLWVMRLVLETIGVMPGFEKKFDFLKVVVVVILSVVLFASLICNTFCLRTYLPGFFILFNNCLGNGLYISKLFLILINRKKIAIILKTLIKDLWPEAEKDKDEMDIVNKYGRFTYHYTSIQIALYFSIAIVVSSPLILELINNLIFIKHLHNFSFFPKFFCESIAIKQEPNRSENVAIFQILVFYITLPSLGSFDALFLYLSLNLSAQLIIIQKRIQKLNKNLSEEDCNKYIGKCVAYHQKIDKLSTDLKSGFAMMILYHFFLSGLYLCICCYVFIAYKYPNTVLMHKALGITISLFQLFAYSYAADQLTTQGEKIAVAAYNCDWIDLAESTKKSINIIILRAQKPIYFSLLGTPVKLETFKMVVQTAFQVFTMLKSTMEPENEY